MSKDILFFSINLGEGKVSKKEKLLTIQKIHKQMVGEQTIVVYK